MGGSLRQLGHEVHYLQEDELDWSTVPALVERLGIQLLLWTRTWSAEMAVVLPVLDELRKLGVPSVSPHLDRWFGLNREHQVDDQPFFRTDLVVSPDDSPRWAEHGVNHLWLPPGVYGPECEPVPPNPRRWPFDVVFVGSHPYPHPEWSDYRTNLLSAFRKAFGRRFAILPRERRGAPIRGRDLQELYATVPVVLGDTCLAGESFQYTSDRIPETLGRGGLLIHPAVKGMVGTEKGDWYMGGHDLMDYDLGDYAEAVDIAKDVLRSPDIYKLVAVQGRQTVLARDTYAHRMATVLGVAEGIHGGYRDVLPAEPPEQALAAARAVFGPFRAETQGRASAPTLVVDESYVGQHKPISAKLHGWSATFHPRPAGIGDGEKVVVQEVWGTNDYGVPPEGFRGTVVDIGANIGAFSVLAARAGAKRVIAYEPDFDNFARLKHHVKLNLASRVTPIQAAVTDGSSPTVSMVGPADSARIESGDEIPTVTLEQIITRYGPIEFCKIDTEGAEFQIFEACPAELLTQVRRMALEFHGPVVTHLAYLDEDGRHIERWQRLVTKLADTGRTLIFGHPGRGGLIQWSRY
jgi:FkbM family methyltransferase